MTKKGVIILKEITLNKMKDLYSDLKAKKCYNENELINSIIENFKDELIFNSNEIESEEAKAYIKDTIMRN